MKALADHSCALSVLNGEVFKDYMRHVRQHDDDVGPGNESRRQL
eukprot:CAMPEP_0180826018 /NCGR_PEP_ID=MMETSP1038_2-20121128/73302_1 /TAXON_ID=632150 /ORGANISM="Azadinium spinosum, Strain 3D9" /LENGTH=43 /DNA_ID= /DNA_START= /DNA_END= /DNA_ORIENTATION=